MPNKTIYEFNPGIYPRLLWITVGCPIETIREKFGKDFPEMDKDACADTCRAYTKTPKDRGGILIRFRSKAEINFENVCHEAGHAALEIFNYCECAISPDNQEPFTYLLGWVAKCCWKVKANKVKDD